MPAGRPPKYDPKYCEDLIEHMKEGYSYESFAAIVETHKQTLYNWEKKYPEFLDAKKQAFDHCRLFWEKHGVQGMWGGKEFSAPVWIFNMKNRFHQEWKDKHEIEAGPETRKSLGLAYKLEEDEE